jgi:hypothetical protein
MVSIDYGFEQDGGMPRAVTFDENHPDSKPRTDIYGQLDIVLTCGTETFEPLIWDVADQLDPMFTNLAADLLACCTGSEEVRRSNQRDFRMRREGERLLLIQDEWFNTAEQKLMRDPAEARVFSIDLTAFATRLFDASRRYQSEISRAIGKWGEAATADFRTFMDATEAKVRRALGG